MTNWDTTCMEYLDISCHVTQQDGHRSTKIAKWWLKQVEKLNKNNHQLQNHFMDSYTKNFMQKKDLMCVCVCVKKVLGQYGCRGIILDAAHWWWMRRYLIYSM